MPHAGVWIVKTKTKGVVFYGQLFIPSKAVWSVSVNKCGSVQLHDNSETDRKRQRDYNRGNPYFTWDLKNQVWGECYNFYSFSSCLNVTHCVTILPGEIIPLLLLFNQWKCKAFNAGWQLLNVALCVDHPAEELQAVFIQNLSQWGRWDKSVS